MTREPARLGHSPCVFWGDDIVVYPAQLYYRKERLHRKTYIHLLHGAVDDTSPWLSDSARPPPSALALPGRHLAPPYCPAHPRAARGTILTHIFCLFSEYATTRLLPTWTAEGY